MEAVLRERPLRRRSEPQVVVDARRHRLVGRACRWCRAVCSRARAPCRRLPSLAAAHAARIASRRAGCCGSACRAGRCGCTCARPRRSAATFEDVVRARLLDVDVLACLAGPDGRQRVPVVRRRDRHDVDVLALEHLAVIRVHGRLLEASRFQPLHLRADVAFIHVAQAGNLHIVHPGPRAHVVSAPPSKTRDADADGVIRALHASHRSIARQDGGAHEEVASIHGDSFESGGEPGGRAEPVRRFCHNWRPSASAQPAAALRLPGSVHSLRAGPSTRLFGALAQGRPAVHEDAWPGVRSSAYASHERGVQRGCVTLHTPTKTA